MTYFNVFVCMAFIMTMVSAQVNDMSNNETEKILLYYLGGQSNMDGFGINDKLPEDLKDQLKDQLKNVWIFHGNPEEDGGENGGVGVWSRLREGHGVGFEAKKGRNLYSEHFGVELTFAQTLLAQHPDEKIAIIKYSRGGSSIDSLAAAEFGSWAPDFQGKKGINQYDHFLATLNNAFGSWSDDPSRRKYELVPAGIIWMQGESDATIDEDVAARYYDNLKHLMDLIRAAFRTDDLPVVIGRISDSWDNEVGKVWTYGELIQHCQEKFVRLDSCAEIVRSTMNYKYSDPWHYDSDAYLDLGKRFAEAVLKLRQR